MTRTRRRVAALTERHVPCPVERRQPRRRVVGRLRARQELCQSLAPLGQRAPHLPEPPQRRAQPQPPERLPQREARIERRPHVVLLSIPTSEPVGLLGTIQRQAAPFGEL